ncbi:replication protein A 70 kDa DNA-binding subunit-like isoform X2 [Hippocampus comes]|uniref:replication protein A 70 kDa DNA-binding subunit-like isoform X2 n=1 Tax=Hippocampus comes TaxID=109280 RepID=UPI00094F03AF|nr:PREDICTED: replication protein A 70 kDa DNA-binding subunit-like isoform X2 [Hippocampus comes]
MSVKLTQGAIEALFNESTVKNPVLQVMNICEFPTAKEGHTRYRLNLSDGVHCLSCFLLATHLNHLREAELLEPNCVCVLKKTVSSSLASRRVVAVLDLDVLLTAAETGGKIGNPAQLTDQTPGQQEVQPSTSGSDEIAGPSGHCASSGRSSLTKAPGMASLTGSGLGSPPPAPSQSPKKLTLINQLAPYHCEWTIRARVTVKSHIRTWSNSRGEGKFFSFDVVDQSGEIRILAFNKQVDKFFPRLEQNQVYLISNGSLKVANKQFTSLNNDYEIALSPMSRIAPCHDGRGVPSLRCLFVPIAQLEDKEPDTILDVIGVCEEAEDAVHITSKAGEQLTKRALTLIDCSGKTVTLTLWGEQAQMFDASRHPVVAIKGARLSTFDGRSLSALCSTTLTVDPDIPEASALRAWYERAGRDRSLTGRRSTSGQSEIKWKTLAEVKAEQMACGQKAEDFSCVATVIASYKENCLYQACPGESCYKKVCQLDDGRYRCDKCGTDYPNFEYRFMLPVNLADFGHSVWATCFQEAAETLLGISADQLGHLKETDEKAFNKVFRKIQYTTHVFRSRVKLQRYDDEYRLKVTVMEVLPVDHQAYCRRLLDNIRSLPRADSRPSLGAAPP